MPFVFVLPSPLQAQQGGMDTEKALQPCSWAQIPCMVSRCKLLVQNLAKSLVVWCPSSGCKTYFDSDCVFFVNFFLSLGWKDCGWVDGWTHCISIANIFSLLRPPETWVSINAGSQTLVQLLAEWSWSTVCCFIVIVQSTRALNKAVL